MDYYHLAPKDNTDANSYWVCASSDQEARRLVAMNVAAASEAADPTKFDCEIDATKTPPQDFIFRRLKGPILISRT